MSVINTRADLDALAASDPSAHADFIARLRASLVTRYDVAEYPEGYDRTLTEKDDGYIEPKYEERDTPETAARFGYTSESLA